MLQSLIKRYEETGGGLPGWQPRPIDYGINLDEDGLVLEILALAQLEGKKRVRRTLIVPEEPQGRTSGIKPAFLCDNASYLFGADQKRGQEKRAQSAILHEKVLAAADSNVAKAVRKFFMNQVNKDDLPETGTYVFLVNGRFAHEDVEVAESWNVYRAAQTSDETIRCLVTGQMGSIAKLHGKIVLQGVSMGAVPIVSCNSESFTSYGKNSSDPAASISEQASFAYVSALNALLKSTNHHQRIGIDTIVYWAEGKGEAEAETITWMMQPQEEDADKLVHIMEAQSQGQAVDIEGCELKRKFNLLCLSPNAGRISVRFFIRDTFGNMLDNIIQHYLNLEISSPSFEKFSYLPPWILLSETTVSKKAGDVAPLLGGQLLESILTAGRYPQTFFNAILTRIRAGEKVSRVKAAIVKAVLIRNYQEGEVTTVALNPNSHKKPYVLGRLFAVLEHLQRQAAGGSLNTTIKDRYFSSASSNPGSVFPTLLKLSIHHSAKLDNAVFHERLKTDLLGRLDEDSPFPSTLSLEDQGRFILGYYHQMQDFFTPRKDKEQREDQ